MDLKCPTCQKEIEWSSENKHRPFCSHRCKLIDLGEWANEENRTISSPIFPLEGLDEEIEQSLEDPDKLH